MNREKEFWRLLGDYERLLTDESVALRETDITALTDIQSRKTDVCQAVLSAAHEAGVILPTDRFLRLIARQKENLALTQKHIASMGCEKQNLAAAAQRLNHVSRAYKRNSTAASTLTAQS